MPSTTEDQVYVRHLLPEKQGFPLYHPEPSGELPLEYRKRGVGIGDVGIITPNGLFNYVFNIFIPESDREINCFGVPDGFVPLQLDPQGVKSTPDKYVKGSSITSNCTASFGNGTVPSAPAVVFDIEVNSSPDEIAALAMPDGALGEDYYNKKAIRTFSIAHALSWYEFINDKLGREAANGSLYVVTGCDRSTAWGLVTDQKTSSPRSLSLQFTASERPYGSYSCEWTRLRGGTVERVSNGASRLALGPDIKQPQNQCLFVRGYKIMGREIRMASWIESIVDHSDPESFLRQQVGPYPGTSEWILRTASSEGNSNQNQESDYGWSAEKELDPYVGAYHPLDTINRYLLDHTQAKIAITHESDWWPLSPDGIVPNESEINSRLATHYTISTESEGAFLTPIAIDQSEGGSSIPINPATGFYEPN